MLLGLGRSTKVAARVLGQNTVQRHLQSIDNVTTWQPKNVPLFSRLDRFTTPTPNMCNYCGTPVKDGCWHSQRCGPRGCWWPPSTRKKCSVPLKNQSLLGKRQTGYVANIWASVQRRYPMTKSLRSKPVGWGGLGLVATPNCPPTYPNKHLIDA